MTALEPSPIVDRIKAELKVLPIPAVSWCFKVYEIQKVVESWDLLKFRESRSFLPRHVQYHKSHENMHASVSFTMHTTFRQQS